MKNNVSLENNFSGFNVDDSDCTMSGLTREDLGDNRGMVIMDCLLRDITGDLDTKMFIEKIQENAAKITDSGQVPRCEDGEIEKLSYKRFKKMKNSSELCIMYHYFKHLEILDDIPVPDIKLPILEEIAHLNNTADQ